LAGVGGSMTIEYANIKKCLLVTSVLETIGFNIKPGTLIMNGHSALLDLFGKKLQFWFTESWQ